ncbi:AAA+-type ATPase [Handroanthus impetiginosus]|uniref:AAA+-type ATPase n=1 Tax=Handroanthus impetiginosus TaxID=429701 RepID=A0A2G9HGT6_9LAMI|nr:AAA+-type ATPase [Handroanthus impetiginosus]
MPSMASSSSSNTAEMDKLNGPKADFIARKQEIEQDKKDLPVDAVERGLLEEVSNNDVLMEAENADTTQQSSSSSSATSWRAEEAIAGNSEALQALRELISYPILYSRESKILGLKWPRGLLLYGPPGTGKTSLVRAVARESGVHLTVISPHSVHKPHAGESEESLRKAFAEAAKHAPSVIFIDEIDGLCPRRDSRSQQNTRIATQLFLLMDSINSSLPSESHVVVVASTNRVDAIDPALRRSGRFDAEVEVSTPNEGQRLQILKLYTKKLPLDPSVDLEGIAASCYGYVGADIEALCREAVMSALKRSLDKHQDFNQCSITMDDWKYAKSLVRPSITRGVTVEIPKVSWDDIGGLKEVKKKLQQAVEWPLKHSSTFSRLRVSPIRGILLHGPPGCSKTTLAKAAASAAQASFFSLCGAELFSMYVGEGEALLRNTFRKARLAAPSIIFFDEADVVGAERGGSSKGSTTVGERLLSTLLTEMDGLEEAKGILVLAATNRPYAIDAALMRPGRFDLVLYVPPPDLEARYDILHVHTRNMSIENDVDLRQIAEDTELFTGAELEGLCKEAGIIALREDMSATVVSNRHFQTAVRSLKPGLTREEIDSYASFHKKALRRPSSPSESSFKPGRNRAKSLLLSAAPVGIVMVSVALYAGLKIISGVADVNARELART